jgi:hypothetical protein
VNIFLIPYTPLRHLSVAFVCAGAGLLAWWLVLAATWTGAWWDVTWDGALFLGGVSGTVAASSIMAEGMLRREALWRRVGKTALALVISTFLAIFWYWGWARLVAPVLFSGDPNLQDDSLVALRYRVAAWVFTGLGASMGPIIVRRLAGVLTHLAAGIAAGLLGAATWHTLGYSTFEITFNDLYLASAMGAAMFGATFGALSWGVPESLYAGWLRVVTETRHGRRIPIDGKDGLPRERFVGHYPRGLDLFLPAPEGVLELHLSVLVTRDQRYRARGVSQAPTTIRRWLEKINLRYDPRRPAPLETPLRSGDRILLSSGGEPTVLEFVMLPREEQ